jgi:chalcone isomerase
MAVPELTVEGVVFPPVVACPPGSGRKHFLAGGGALTCCVPGHVIYVLVLSMIN